MKNIILLLIFVLSFGMSYSQDYPIYQYDSLHRKVAVTISLRQAQLVDNDYDILNLLEKSKDGCDSLSLSYQLVIKDLSRIVATQDIKISDLTRLNNENDSIINNLKEQIQKYIEDQVKCNQQIGIKDQEIVIYKKEVNKQKIEKIAGFSVGGVLIGVGLGGIIYGFASGHLVIK